MIGNYQYRKVDNYRKDGLRVSTCLVTDSKDPFETAVSHLRYNNGEFIIVETYENKQQAQKGHLKWVNIMTSEKLPNILRDNSNNIISQLVDLSGDEWRDHSLKELK